MMRAVLFVAPALAIQVGEPQNDKLCNTGITDIQGTFCCPKKCGSCDDGQGDICNVDSHDLKIECCPKIQLEGALGADKKLKVGGTSQSCDKTFPPCKLGEAYKEMRTKAKTVKASSIVGDKPNAKDDCNEVLPGAALASQVAQMTAALPNVCFDSRDQCDVRFENMGYEEMEAECMSGKIKNCFGWWHWVKDAENRVKDTDRKPCVLVFYDGYPHVEFAVDCSGGDDDQYDAFIRVKNSDGSAYKEGEDLFNRITEARKKFLERSR